MLKAVISIVFLATVANTCASSAQAKSKTVKPKLAVVIQSARFAYSIKESIGLEIQLKNTGKKPLLVCRYLGWAPGHTELRVVSSNGEDVHTNFFPDEVPPPPGDNDFVALNPGKSLAVEFSDVATDLVNTPGPYIIFVTYRSPVSKEWAQEYLHLPHLALWSRERGTIVSNKITIEITK
ncbi:MAG TPA: hypothetical protein VGU63_00025 [Candidatus Acidoferrales bacterium]|nr:hypothetical protein [Candidatus Acidoferrales bacterium]